MPEAMQQVHSRAWIWLSLARLFSFYNSAQPFSSLCQAVPEPLRCAGLTGGAGCDLLITSGSGSGSRLLGPVWVNGSMQKCIPGHLSMSAYLPTAKDGRGP